MDKMVKGDPAPEFGDKPKQDDDVFDGIINVDPSRNGKPSLGFDYERYAALLGDIDISLEDKQAITKALWSVVMQFVELGFGVHPIQQALEARRGSCGQVEDDSGTADSELLHSPQNETEDA